MLRSRDITQLYKTSSRLRIIASCFEWGTSVWIKRYTYCFQERKIMTSPPKDSCYHFSVTWCNSKMAWVKIGELCANHKFSFSEQYNNNYISSKEASSELLFMITVSQSGFEKTLISAFCEQRTWKSPPRCIAGTFFPFHKTLI